MLLLLLVLALLGEGVHMAPLPYYETAEDEIYFEGSGDSGDIQDQLDQLLKNAMLNDTDNVKKIEDRFNLTQYEQILCIGVSYTITYGPNDTHDHECGNITFSNFSHSNIWLSFDPHSFSGRVLLEYAALNWKVLGFDWGEACDITDETTLHLMIRVSPIPQFLCDADMVDMSVKALDGLTEQVTL